MDYVRLHSYSVVGKMPQNNKKPAAQMGENIPKTIHWNHQSRKKINQKQELLIC